MSTSYEEFINQVKKTIQDQPIPPIYNPKEWKGKGFNCYLYAMRACMDFDYHGYHIRPGFISKGKRIDDYEDTEECILRYFKEDCKALKLNIFPTTISESISKNEYKIAVYVKRGRDYHFARQDSNGNWSEKNGWCKEIEILEEEDVAKDHDEYRFIGVFRVSKKVE